MKKELVQNCPIPRLTFLSNSILTFTLCNLLYNFFKGDGHEGTINVS